jgi:endonuclease YncB( thermonuclease family)
MKLKILLLSLLLATPAYADLDKAVEFTEQGKYFRVVANVVVDGVSLEQELLDNKLAYEYDGGKKLSWCN